MEALLATATGLGLGLTRLTGIRVRTTRTVTSKDRAIFAMGALVLIPSFLLIAFGRNCTECFGLIGLVVGHFFGREMGKSECPPTDK
jgi:hypothetical protein